MKLATKIFRRSDWYVTSPFGWRNCPYHGREHHNGTDYGTNVKKWPQYALEDGYVQKIHKGTTGYGNYVWVRYPRLDISLLHAHLDSISVKKGDKVKEGTLIGYTGKTGNATGIHMHLGMTKIGSDKWLNPHEYDYQEKPKEDPKPSKRTYTVKRGDTLWAIAKKYYGNGNKYPQIAKANNLKNPDLIKVGQVLIIP